MQKNNFYAFFCTATVTSQKNLCISDTRVQLYLKKTKITIMKQTFKFSVLLVLLAALFFNSSCEGNLEVDCELYDVDITLAIDSSGAILTANVVEGTPEYNYIWSTGEITSSILVKAEGTYGVTVTDGNECTDEAAIEVVLQTDCLDFSASISGSDSLLVAIGQGGTEPYIYEWSEGSTTQAIDVFEDGVYEVTITDADGCVATASYTVETDDCAGFVANINILMDSMNNTTILVGFATGGTAPYSYLWSNGESSPEIQPNTFGTYTLKITDANGCVSEATAVYQDNSNPCSTFVLEMFAIPDTTMAGSFILGANSLDGSIIDQYIWSTGETTPTIVVQPSGIWTVVVGNEFGCDAVGTITL